MNRVAILACLAFMVFGCDAGLPDLRIEQHEGSVTVHFETLGEYPTKVSRLLLKEARSGRTVWELRRSDGIPELWKVIFRVGENTSCLESVTGGGSMQVVVPREDSTFFLESGREYVLTVWSKSGRSSRTTHLKL